MTYVAMITASPSWRTSLWLVYCMASFKETLSQNGFNATCQLSEERYGASSFALGEEYGMQFASIRSLVVHLPL